MPDDQNYGRFVIMMKLNSLTLQVFPQLSLLFLSLLTMHW